MERKPNDKNVSETVVDSVEQQFNNFRSWADRVSAVHLISDSLKFAGLKIAQAKFKKTKEQTRTLTNFFSSAQSVLVILPYEYKSAVDSGRCLQILEPQLGQMNVTYVDFLSVARPIQDTMFFDTIRFSPSDMNRFGIPREEFLRKIRKKKYDVALDLNFDFELVSAYICKASNAIHRVGFDSINAQQFYNILLKATPIKAGQKSLAYEWAAQCIKQF